MTVKFTPSALGAFRADIEVYSDSYEGADPVVLIGTGIEARPEPQPEPQPQPRQPETPQTPTTPAAPQTPVTPAAPTPSKPAEPENAAGDRCLGAVERRQRRTRHADRRRRDCR